MHSETFKTEHLEKIIPAGGGKVPGLIIEQTKASERNGSLIAFSLMHNNEIVAIGGICEIWPGVGDSFSIMSESAMRYPKSLFAAFAANLKVGLKIGGFRRVQASVLVGFDAGVRFIEKLGYEREGIMKAWGPDGSDYFLYARTI